MSRQRYWCCPSCETLCLMSQATCGGCGAEQSGDVGELDVDDVYSLTMDAAYSKPKPKPKKRRR